MAGTFLDELARLNTQNFLGGLTQVGEAIKEQRQNETVANLYNKFSVKRQELMTTDEQLSEFNKEVQRSGDLTGDKVEGVIDAISKATLNLDKILQQTTATENIYRPYITAFATLGDEGVKIANTLSRELEAKKELYEKKADIPFKELEYENAMYQKVQNKMQLMSGAITLDNLKSDTEAQNLLMDIMDTEIGKQVFIFNTNTGQTNFKPKEIYSQLQKIYGNNPAFGKAWLLLEKHIYDTLQKYDPPAFAPKGGDSSVRDAIVTNYSILHSMSNKYGRLLNDKETPNQVKNGQIILGNPTKSSYDWVRKAYIDQATIMDRKNIKQIGSDLSVINEIDNTAAKEELKWIYDHFYDTSNEEYYWKYVNALKASTGSSIASYNKNIPVNGLPFPLDMSQIITNEAGWWNPYEIPVHQTQIEHQNIKEFQQKNKKREINQEWKSIQQSRW